LGCLVASAPAVTPERRLAIGPWLSALGLREDMVEILDLIPNPRLPELLATMDCALFPNRCEGGTNLVAMECMALGVPTILSANTGHTDLIEAGNCLALQRQRPLKTVMPQGVEGWGESDIDEIVEALDALYRDPALGRSIGIKAAATLERLAWPQQIDRLLDLIGPAG
jgi:glycosyltransferase involved in cell wall biosynthesis